MRGQLGKRSEMLRDALALPGAGAYTDGDAGLVLARAGKLGRRSSCYAELEAAGRDSYVSPVAFAILHVGLGNLDRALDWAERAYSDKRGWLGLLERESDAGPAAQNESRFKSLLQKMRL